MFCPMLCRSRGYLVSRCISVGIMSFSCRRRHRGRLSASWGDSGAEAPALGAHLCDGDTSPSPRDPGQTPSRTQPTCTKAQKRGSLRCLALSCSKAKDWRLQKREEIFWNQLPSAPSNYSEIQARGCLRRDVEAQTGGQGWGPRSLASRSLAGRRVGAGLGALTRASSTSPISSMT